MTTINLDALSASDISPIFNALHHYLRQHGLALVTDNVFLKPENLAKRWGLSISCLNNWRFTGGGPVYIKTGPGPKAQVRYPMLGENGVLMFEQKRMYRSTAQESASIETATSQLIPSD
jgi:hypothetical protein